MVDIFKIADKIMVNPADWHWHMTGLLDQFIFLLISVTYIEQLMAEQEKTKIL